MDGFTEQTGIAVNVTFFNKGMIERLRAEGKRSLADLVFTTDISRLHNVVSARLTQPVQDASLAQNIPAAYRDLNNHWFGLTTRVRIIYASKT